MEIPGQTEDTQDRLYIVANLGTSWEFPQRSWWKWQLEAATSPARDEWLEDVND